jgi:glycine C-acetyltransferase
MYETLKPVLIKELEEIKKAGLFKKERVIITPQDAVIKTTEGKEVINFCANNYLGFVFSSRVMEAAKEAIDTHGYGMSSGAVYLWYTRYS